jgi:hypothetical protein
MRSTTTRRNESRLRALASVAIAVVLLLAAAALALAPAPAVAAPCSERVSGRNNSVVSVASRLSNSTDVRLVVYGQGGSFAGDVSEELSVVLLRTVMGVAHLTSPSPLHPPPHTHTHAFTCLTRHSSSIS